MYPDAAKQQEVRMAFLKSVEDISYAELLTLVEKTTMGRVTFTEEAVPPALAEELALETHNVLQVFHNALWQKTTGRPMPTPVTSGRHAHGYSQ